MTEIEQKIRQVLQEKNDKITPSNIRNGVEIFNITGTYTSDGNVTTYDIANGKIGYANGQRIVGRLPEVLENTITTTGVNFNSIVDDPNNDRFTIKIDNITERILRDNTTLETRVGYSDVNVVQNLNALGITSSNIRQGVSILGINGGLEPKGDESDATVTAEDIMKDKIAYANNERVIGTFSLDNELAEQNNIITNQENKISQLENLVTNIYSSDVNVVTADGNITSNDVLAGKIGYANGQRIVGSLSTVEFMMPSGLRLENSTAQNLDLTTWNTSQVSNVTSIFTNCQNLINLNVSTWNTDNFVSLHETFYNCIRITNLNLINWNTINVTDLHGTFANCKNLTDLSINTWNTSNVTDLVTTFANCYKLVNFEFLKDWNTSNVIDMGWTFFIVRNVKNLPISDWDVSNVSRFAGTFWFDQNISDMDLSKWNISNAIFVNDMFHGCTSLININLSNWYSSKLTNIGMMFNLCNKLSDASIDSIINMCLNATSVTYKTLNTNNQYSPFNGTNITNVRYQNRWDELTQAGWIY